MALRVLVVPDKFKGTLTAGEVAAALAQGWRAARNGDEVEQLPMSDGGDGFGHVTGQLLNAEVRTTKTEDAVHRTLNADWWWEPKSRTAIIEAARINGLAQLPRGKYHPFELDSFGLGAVLKDAAKAGAKHCIMGIGGSATNDGGFGVARGMGWEFYNVKSAVIDRWTDLHTLSQIKPPRRERWFEQFSVAVDVNNPLLGQRGCTRVYGPQKGLKETDFEFAERCLSSLASIAQQELHVNTAEEPGGGAAGGLGFGLRTFLGARLVPGFELFASVAGLAARIAAADVVVTGEGAIDDQTMMGKGVGELAALCRKFGKPCLAVSGVIVNGASDNKLFARMISLTSLTSETEALTHASQWVETAARRVAEEW